MNTFSLLILLFTTIGIATVLASRLRIAYPIAYVLCGLAFALVPGLPAMPIEPEWMLGLFLPPILMEAAYFTSYRDFQRNLRPILQLAVGLVFFSAFVMAYLLQWMIPGAGWALGFLLGAMIAPPDAVAATSIIKHMHVPKRIVTVLEGESLINDASGLVLYKFALAAVLTGSFSATHAAGQFAWAVVIGTGIGLLAGYALMRIFPYIREVSVEVMATFLLPYAVYHLAEGAHGSGVLAVVAAGLVVGWRAPETFTPAFRLSAEAVWRVAVYVLNGLVFLLIGLIMPGVLARLSDYSVLQLFSWASAVFVLSVITRFVWVYAMAYGTLFLFPRLRKKEGYPAWQNVFIVAWTGMRGVVTVATALALPLSMSDGSAFPSRSLLIFLAVSVVFFTLVLQGLLLPWLVRTLRLDFNPALIQEEWEARVEATQEALKRLDELAVRCSANSSVLARIRSHYQDRLQSLGDGPNTPLSSEHAQLNNHPLQRAEHQIWTEALAIERQVVVSLRKAFRISDDVMNDLLRELDHMATRFYV